MRLFALRGAISVERNDAEADPRRHDELMREIIERNELHRSASSAASSRRPTTSTRSSRRSPRARSASRRVPLLCAREIDVPGSLPRVIRVLIHYYAEEEHVAKHVYLGEALRTPARADLAGGTIGRVALEFSARVARIPSYPVAGGYAGEAPPVRLASNESPYPPLPAVREAIERALGDAEPLSRPVQLAAAPCA